MANRLIEGWKNIPFPPAVQAARTGWVAIPNSAYYVLTGDVVGATQQSIFEVQSDGWLRCQQLINTSYGHRMGIGRPFSSSVTISATTVLFGGFRYKTPAINAQPPRVFDIFDHSLSINGSPTYQNLVPLSALGAFQANTEYYIEWSIDMTTSTFKYRIDRGTEVVGTLTAAMVTALLAQRCSWVIGTLVGQTASSSWCYIYTKDIYINEKIATGNNNGWVGSIQAVPLYVESVSGSSTVSGADDAKSALNSPVLGQTDWDTPLVTTDPAAPTLDIKLGMADVTGNLLAVQLNVGAKRPANSLAGVRVALKSGSTTGSSVLSPLVQSTKLGIQAISADATPENKPWTRAELLAATVKLTASNA